MTATSQLVTAAETPDGAGPGWRVAVATATGAAHLADGTHCQDRADVRRIGDHVLVAVADGAGSAEAAAIGAELAAGTALDALATRFGAATVEDRPAAIRAAFAEAREALTHLATADARPLAAYATTLTCLVAWPRGAIVGRLGDGFAVVADVAGGLQAIPPVPPERGEYANETVFLTSQPAETIEERLQIAEVEGPVHAIAVSTDGLLRLAIELATYRPFARFFRPLFAFAAGVAPASANSELTAFLASDRVRARTDDDVTLVLAVWNAGEDARGESDERDETGDATDGTT